MNADCKSNPMRCELLAYTRPNPALDPAELTGVDDLATILVPV